MHDAKIRSGPGKPNQRKVNSWIFCRGIPEQKFNVNRACFPKEKHQNSQKMGEIHEFFVLALFLVWFARATPEKNTRKKYLTIELWNAIQRECMASSPKILGYPAQKFGFPAFQGTHRTFLVPTRSHGGKLTVCKLGVHCKGEAQKSPLFWRFCGGFWFSQDRLFSRNSTRKPLNLIKSRIFTNAPCKTACLYNAPSMHTLEKTPQT